MFRVIYVDVCLKYNIHLILTIKSIQAWEIDLMCVMLFICLHLYLSCHLL